MADAALIPDAAKDAEVQVFAVPDLAAMEAVGAIRGRDA